MDYYCVVESNYSVGLRICCADRKIRGKASENPIIADDFNGFSHVTVRELNSYS